MYYETYNVHKYMDEWDGWMDGDGWMNGWMDGWMDTLMKGQTDASMGWMDGWMGMDEWTNEWMDEWMDGWMDEWMDERMDGFNYKSCFSYVINLKSSYSRRSTSRHTRNKPISSSKYSINL